MNFYVGGARFLPPVLTQLGLALVAFNRRVHDILSTRNSRIVENCDHLYNGREAHVACIVADWLVKTVGLPR